MNRNLTYTKPVTLKIRHQQWEESCQACQKHIALAKAFQTTGEKIIQQLQQETSLDPLTLVKQYQLCLGAIEKGISFERQAQKELESLYLQEPKDT
jgi:hypothetical protein